MKKLLLFCLLMFSFSQITTLYAQQRVTGTVLGAEDKQPLPGVSVKIKGTQSGTITDGEGKYSIRLSAESKVLVFSYIGFNSKEVAISNTSSVNASLTTNSKELGEVVVTSFGIARDRSQLGYGTAQIKSEDLTTAKTTNVTNALNGKVSGVQVSGSGGAFTGSGVIIRGYTTFTGSNQPLYVVDGVPIESGGGGTPLQTGPSRSNRAIDINPDDIENIQVLKGAAATVLYGSRAASGVILVTTKKGLKNSKGRIDFSSSYNAGNINRLPEYQNEYAQGNNGVFTPGSLTNSTIPAGLNTSWGPRIMGQTVTDYYGRTGPLMAYPDNVKDLFQTANNYQNNLSFTGGTEKSTYRLAYGNTYETYVLTNNSLKRNNISFNGTTNISDKFRVGTSINYVNNASRRTQQGNSLANPLFRAYFTPRSYDLTNSPYQNALGEQQWFGAEDNPYWSMEHIKYNDEINRVYGNLNFGYDFTDWLKADLKVGTDYYNSKSNGFDEIGNRGGGNVGASSRGVGGILEFQENVRNFNSYFTLTGQKKFGDFNFAATLGNEINQNAYNSSQVQGITLVVRNFNNLKNAVTYIPTYGLQKSRLLGVFGDFSIDYKSFLTLNLKARNDWSSTLTPENRSIFYPAVATSFVLTEAFPQIKSDYVNRIKFRANIGEIGKGAGIYSTDSYYVSASAGDGFGPTISFPFNTSIPGYTLSNTAGNPNLTPEFTREIEVGGEFAFFNNRLSIDGSYYNRKTRSVILDVPYSNASGVGTVTQNAGKLTTKGFELLVTGTPLKTEKGAWDIGVTFTKFKSVVNELAPGVSNIFLGGFTTPNIRLVAGDQYGQIYGSDYVRDAQGRVIISANGLPTPTAGVVKIGNPNPDWLMGVTNNIRYQGITVSFLLDIRKGGDQYSRNIADIQRNGATLETAEFNRFEADGVTQTKPYVFEGVNSSGQPNTVAVTAQQYWGNAGKFVAATGYIFDTSWFRIREAAISYAIPKSLLAKTPFGSASLGVFGRNLYLRAPNYPHFDPEQNALGISNAQGLEFNALPSTRTIGVNLKLSL